MRKYRGDGHADEGDGADKGSGQCTGNGFANDRRTRSDIFSDQRRHQEDPVGRGEGPAKCSEASTCGVRHLIS